MFDLETHTGIVVKRLLEGRAVPVLGAGVNRCGPHRDSNWAESPRPPDGGELASLLADELSQPELADQGLLAVSQYVELLMGWDPLYQQLHDVFERQCDATPVHTFLAALAGYARRHGLMRPLILTTNYDDVLERELDRLGEDYDVLTYIATPDHEHRGRFKHVGPDGGTTFVVRPNEYEVSRYERTVIVKIHGGVDHSPLLSDDSYVITEDHYIDYMARNDVAAQLPVNILASLNFAHILFLGYSLRDWNLRVFFRRIWGPAGGFRRMHWAVQRDPTPFDQHFWHRQEVTIIDTDLDDYMAGLSNRLEHEIAA